MAIISNQSLQGVRELNELLELTEKNLKDVSAAQKKLVKNLDLTTAKGHKTLNEELKTSALREKELIQIENEKVKLLKTEEQLLQAKNRTQTQVRKEQERQIKITKRLKRETEKLTSRYQQESALLNRLRKRFKDLALTEGTATSKTRRLATQIKKLDTRLRSADAAVGQFQRNVGNYSSALTGSLGAVGQFTTGAGAIAGAVLLAGSAIRSAVGIIKDFEQAGANLAATLGDLATEDNINKLAEDAKNLGASTAFSATEVRSLQTEFAKLGFNPDAIINATEATLNLAAATGSDLAEAAAIAGATLGGFGLAADQTQRVTDLMARSFSISALDIDKFRESMKTAAPAARAVGISVEETTALLGTLANAGISGSKAGTSLATAFINLNEKGLNLEKGLEKVSVSSDKLGTAVDLVGKEAAKAFLVLAEGTKVTEGFEKSLLDAGGAAKAMADIQLDTLEGSIKILNSSWEGLILSMEDGSGVMSDIAKFVLRDLATALSIISGESKEAKKEFSFLGTIMTAIKTSFEVLISVVKLFILPIRLAVDLIGRLAERLGLTSERLKDVTGSFQFFVQVLNNIPELIGIIVDVMSAFFLGLGDAVVGTAKIFRGFFRGIGDGFAAAGTLAKDFALILVNIFDEEERNKAIAKFQEDLGKGLISAAASKDIKDGSDAIGKAFLGGLTDSISVAKFRIEALFKDDEALKLAKQAGEDQENARQDGVEDVRKARQPKSIKELQQEKDDEGLNALLLSRQKRAAAIAKETSTSRVKDFNESEQFNEKKLTSALNSIRKETEETRKEIELRRDILLQNENLTKNARTKIREEATEELRKIENDSIQRQLDLQAQANEQALEQEDNFLAAIKKKLTSGFDFAKGLIDKGIQAQRKAHQERLNQFDEEIAASKKLQDSLAEDARRGVADAEENLVFAREKEREATLERIQEVERQKRVEEGLVFLKLLANNAGNPNVKQPVLTSIAQFTAARLFISALGGLYEGTEDTGTVNNPLDSKGGRLKVLHDHERVVPKKDNIKMEGISNAELGHLAEQYKLGKLIEADRKHKELHIINNYQSNNQMLNKMDELIKSNDNAYKKIKQTNWSLDALGRLVEEVSGNGKRVKNTYEKDGIF